MRPLLVLALLCLSGALSSAATPSGAPLRRVFHPLLLEQHLRLGRNASGATSTSTSAGASGDGEQLWDEDEALEQLVRSHFVFAQQKQQQQPFLTCGPVVQAEELRRKQTQAEQLVGEQLVHVVHLSASGEEACLLLLATDQQQQTLLTSWDKWAVSPIPYLFKIHHDVVEQISEEKPFSSSVAPASSHLPLEDNKPRPPGESLQLVIQFFPGLQFLEAEWDELLQTWSQQSTASRVFQQHMSAVQQAVPLARAGSGEAQADQPLHSWEELRRKHATRDGDVDGDTFDHCDMPASAQIKFDAPASATSRDSAVVKIVDLSGWTASSGSSSTYCLLKFIEVLSAHDAVLSLNIASRPVTLNYDARGISQSGTGDKTPFSDMGLLGNGQVVGVADSGLDDKSCFFWDNSNYYSSPYTTRQGYGSSGVESHRRKVVQYTAFADAYDAAAGHGTHVVGTIVGNSISADFSRANGVAPGAKVAFYDIQKESQSYLDMPGLASSVFPTMYRAGARVFSNSWGSPGSSTYADSSYDVDAYSYNNPEVLILFASGNSGAYGKGSVFSPCASKNALCVGSVDSRNDGDDGAITSSRVSYFSSQGPTGDGRIKPDVVAPGFKVVSALSGGKNGGDKFCGVYETFGTSMATPVVSGGALVLREYFMDLWGSICLPSYSYCKSFEPSGYLLKALIIHTGQAVSTYSESVFDSKTDVASFSLGNGPDSVQGYGAVNFNAFVPVSEKQRATQDLYVIDSFSASGRHTATLIANVRSQNKPLKVTLAWYDMPSVVGNSANLLLLNLDLVVTSPSGHVYYGNGVNGDSVHTQEQVLISSPEKGSYEVAIKNNGGISVKCALVVTCAGEVTSELDFSSSRSLSDETVLSENHNPEVSVSSTITTTEYSVDEKPIPSAVSSPLFFNFDLVKSYTIHNTLSALQKVLLKTFEMPDDSLALFSIDLSLDAHYCSGSEAFIFAVIVVAPNGEIIQIGGYNEYSSLDRLWQRMAPVQWTATSAPTDGGTYWKYTRYVVDLQIHQAGPYEVYIQLLHDSWSETEYFGNVKLNFVDAATAFSRSKSAGGFFSNLGALGAGLLIFFLVGVAVFGMFVVSRKRKELQNAQRSRNVSQVKKKKISSKKTKRAQEEDAPWSNISGLLSDMNSSASSNGVDNPMQTEEKTKNVSHKRYMSAMSSEV